MSFPFVLIPATRVPVGENVRRALRRRSPRDLEVPPPKAGYARNPIADCRLPIVD